ncbi:hypothetical protein FJTKL_09738 [Diaporthe vaccinii]|uniref:Uncharacterized protein n=1 Tax=Diaporthe vaccinii TaxID=105482 RepID=A0ABR4EMM0_9PEZI
MLLRAKSGQMLSVVPTHVLGSPTKGVQQPAVQCAQSTASSEECHSAVKTNFFPFSTRRCESLSSGNLLPNTDG